MALKSVASKKILISKIVYDDENPNSMTPAKKEALRKVIKKHGFAVDLWLNLRSDGKYDVIDGEHRLRVMQEEGATHVTARIFHVDKTELRKMRQIANKLKGKHSHTKDLAELKAIFEAGQLSDYSSMIGDSVDELETILQNRDITVRKQEAALEKKPKRKAKTGKTYRLGNHTLHVGDYADHIDDLHDIDVIFTDPPYLTTALKFDQTSLDFSILFTSLKKPLKQNGWFFLFGTLQMFALAEQAGWHEKFTYIWIKPTAPTNRGIIAPAKQHEYLFAFIDPALKKITDLYFDKKSIRTPGEPYTMTQGRKTEFNTAHSINRNLTTENGGWREPTTILKAKSKRYMGEAERTEHPTQKPLSVCETILRGYCPRDGVIFDPFAGSGSALIAAEQTGRTCIACELNPEYADIIIARWEQLTGQKAELIKQ